MLLFGFAVRREISIQNSIEQKAIHTINGYARFAQGISDVADGSLLERRSGRVVGDQTALFIIHSPRFRSGFAPLPHSSENRCSASQMRYNDNGGPTEMDLRCGLGYCDQFTSSIHWVWCCEPYYIKI